MIETSAWDSVRPLFRELELDPVRVENVLHPGHPDLDYVKGNIELKYLPEFPKRANTKVRLPEFTGEQVAWLTRRWEKGGLCWVLVRVGSEWFLWPGRDARDLRRGLTQAEWRERSSYILAQPFIGLQKQGFRKMLVEGL